MVSQEEFDSLAADYHALKVEWETAKQNLLSTSLITPGTLRFGGNTMQLDKDGIQILNDSAVGAPSLYYVPSLVPTPGSTTPYSVLTGYANVVAANEDVAKMEMAAFGDTGISGSVGTETFNASTGGATAYLTTTEGGVVATLTLTGTGGAATLALANAVPIFSVTADPASLTDGMIWYNSTSDLYKFRQNGVTYTIPTTSGSILTDTAWAAKGDLVAGTANDTAAILSYPGAVGQFLKSNPSTATGLEWGHVYQYSNQTSGYTAAENDFVRCSGTFTVTLPTPATNIRIAVANIGSGVITVAPTGVDTIFTMAAGQTSYTVLPGEVYEQIYYAPGQQWKVY